jgi:sec-independent protein translocase protein TatA
MGLFDSPSHLLIVLLVLVLLFGSAKLPRLAKSLGESMRIFKKEAQQMHGEDSADKTAGVQAAVQPQAVQQQLPAPAPAATPQDGVPAASVPAPEVPSTNQPG